MRKILPLAACLLPAFAIAQPIITGPIDFKVGESMVYEKLQPTQPGPAGAGQTWDFSAVSPIGGDTNWYYCMAPFANAPVPTANLMVVGSDGTYLYYNNQSGQGELVALADSSNSLDLTVVYQDPVKIITRPLTYNDVLVDSCKESYQIDYMGSSYNIDGEGEHQLLADGYGTLVLSDTTYTDVLRVRSEIRQSDVIQLLSIPIDISRIMYLWFVDGVPAPVLRIDSTLISSALFSDDQFSMEKLLHDAPTSIEELDGRGEMAAYFQGNDLILIPEASSQGSIELNLVNLQGQSVQSGMYSLQKGQNRILINQDLSPGIYLLRWNAANQNKTYFLKLLK